MAVCAVVALVAGLALAIAPARAQAQALAVSAQPPLYPAFDPAVTDYVTRCTGDAPVAVTVSAPAGTEVSVDGQGPRSGNFTTDVTLKPGQDFEIGATSGATATTYYVRCLPVDFPPWTYQRPGQPDAEWYGVSPSGGTNYVMLFDGSGVPVWWMKSDRRSLDFHPLSNGNVVLAIAAASKEHRLDGSLVRTLTGVGAGITSDDHEVLLLPNGNYLLIVQRVLTGYDFCGLVNQKIQDQGFQEITPGGALVRQWFPSDHIPMSEVPAVWCSTILGSPAAGAYDVYHTNSLEPVGDDVVMSFRHLDAVYRVNGADGSIEWKLGGTSRAGSLAVLNDPVFAGGDGFGGQHDARVLADGTVTVHDNGVHPTTARQARAVRYAIDTNAMTATLVEQKNDPGTIASAGCCGSARRLPSGNWVISWGAAHLVTELSSSGTRVFSLTFDPNLFTYRLQPVSFGALSRQSLRDGMDAQFPRSYARPQGAPRVRMPLVVAYPECVAPDRTHGPPLGFGSCGSPAGASGFLTVGTPDANGAAANSVGFVAYSAIVGDPATSTSESDVRVRVELSDVRSKSDLSDYTGELELRSVLRITDQANGPRQNETATLVDAEVPFTVPCAATGSVDVGGTCSLSSTLNAITPGFVVEGKRATWQLGQVQAFDGGESGVAGASDATLFATQGIFVP